MLLFLLFLECGLCLSLIIFAAWTKSNQNFWKKFKKVLTNKKVCANIKTSSNERSMIYLFRLLQQFFNNILAKKLTVVRFHNPFPERISQVVRQLHEFIKESRIKNLFYLAGVILSVPWNVVCQSHSILLFK